MSKRCPSRGRTLAIAAVAHVLHDGYTDLLYVLLPVWQAEFGLGYAALAVLRSLYSGVMAAAQVPVDKLVGPHRAGLGLAGGTLVAAAGFALAGGTHAFAGLCAGLVLCGVGSSVQHPQASQAVTSAYRERSREPLGIYNFSGDVGKAALPALTSLLLIALPWRGVAEILAGLGVAVAVVIAALMPHQTAAAPIAEGPSRKGGRGGFGLLFTIGVLDTATRMGFLLFLPFLLGAKGAEGPTIGLGLTLVFAGGALGKFACGWLGARMGLLATVLLTETGTAAAILGALVLPLGPCLALLPLLGTMLNGTSSVLYGTVPELAREGEAGRAFALFYTGTIGAGALAPIGFGALGDAAGRSAAIIAAAATALAILPLAIALAPRLETAVEGVSD
jgi:MFS transporter, FSR family, fosmidomycin resistance protein